jgi:hypothetical protein
MLRGLQAAQASRKQESKKKKKKRKSKKRKKSEQRSARQRGRQERGVGVTARTLQLPQAPQTLAHTLDTCFRHLC